MKHTAGPWRIRKYNTGTKIYAGDVCLLDMRSSVAGRSANARLIAAAPDMYEALKEAEEWMAEPAPPWPNEDDAMEAWQIALKIRASLSKVEGE